MGHSNIQQQIQRAALDAFAEGRSKRDYRLSGGNTQDFVWSGKDLKNIIQTGYEFGRWLKANFPEIKMIRDVKAEHCSAFLADHHKGWSHATVDLKVSMLNKIAHLCSRFYNAHIDWRSMTVPTAGERHERIRTQAMHPEHYAKLLDRLYNAHNTKAAAAVDMGGRYGLRVKELAHLQVGDIDLKRGVIHLAHGVKGGRERTLQIRPQDRQFLEKLIAGKPATMRVFGISADGINKAINRALTELKLKDQYPKTSEHAIRKMVAQRVWDECRTKGMSKTQAVNAVCDFLGHGPNRWRLVRVYVPNMW